MVVEARDGIALGTRPRALLGIALLRYSFPKMEHAARRILVIDRDACLPEALIEQLRHEAFEPEICGAPEAGVRRDAAAVIIAASNCSLAQEQMGAWRQESPSRLPPVLLMVPGSDPELGAAFALDADEIVCLPAPPLEFSARLRALVGRGNARRELARTQRDARVMVELTHALTSSLDFREILFTVVQRVAETMRVERCSIVVARESEDVGFVVAASDDARVRNLKIDLYRYPEIQQALLSRRPLTIDDATSHPLLFDVRAHVHGTRFPSLTLVPIVCDDRAMGVLFLRASEGRGGLDESDLSVCQVVANATAVALRNARLVQRLQEERIAVTSAHVEAERRLQLLERYAELFRSSADGMVVLDLEGRVLFGNPRSSEITGYALEQVQKGYALSAVARVDRALVRRLREGFRRGEYPTSVDVRVRRPTGEVRTLSVATSPVLGEARAVLVAFRDVTDERATARELERTKAFLSSLIESSPDAIIAVRLDGRIALFNSAAERILGYCRQDVVGHMSVEMLYPRGVARDIMRRIRSSPERRMSGFRTEVLSRDGERVPVLLAAALMSENGSDVASVGIFSDIRDRIRLEERLAQFQQQLAVSEKHTIIAELAGAAAHELNQPLTAIQGYAELLQRKADGDSSIGRGAAVILRETERMAEIVRKIGKITRYETKQYVGGTTILDIDRAVDDVDPTNPEDP